MMRSDINFSADDSHRFLPWLIGVMVGLAALLLCIGLSLNHWVVDRHGSYSGSFTVNIPASDNQPERIAKIRGALKGHSGITQITEINPAKLQDMLKPWLGEGKLEDLPLPSVLEVTLDNPSVYMDYTVLQKNLASVVPGIEVDAHERWIAAFSNFSSTVRALTLFLSVLIIGVVIMTIAFASRTSLKLHSKTVHLLHAIGAEDRYIARQFQFEALKLVVPGAILGCIGAGILYWAISAYVTKLNISLLPPLTVTGVHLWLLLIMPAACAAAAWLVARTSIALQLQRVL